MHITLGREIAVEKDPVCESVNDVGFAIHPVAGLLLGQLGGPGPLGGAILATVYQVVTGITVG
jgi:hypothetical protein